MPLPATNHMLTARDLSEVAPLVDGRRESSEFDGRFITYDPASGRKLADIPAGCRADAHKAVVAARASFRGGAWRNAPPSVKKAVLHRWAELIRARAPHLDALDALEMGKPVSLPFANAAAAGGLVQFYAEAVDKICGSLPTSDVAATVIQKLVPRGVVAAIVPWNFPTYNAVLKVAPALAAGNSVVLKPSELSSQSSLLLAELALEAGLPPGALNVVPGCGETVGQALGEHHDVDMVTFTGSSAVGKLMLQYAGRSNMKPVSAECGGKSPHIVFDDGVDLDGVADHVAAMIVSNQGQVCSAGSRLLVQDSVQEPLVDKVIARLKKVVAGNPQSAVTTYGPLVSAAQMAKVLGYVEGALGDGADLVHGGARMLPETGGYFVEPTVFVNVSADQAIAQEEIFGPVLSVLRFRDSDEAVRLANGTCYGLAAYVWTARAATAFKLANAIPAAYSMINAVAPAGEGPGHALSGEPCGASGVGVEGGLAGLASYLRRQTLWFNHG